MQKYLKEDLFPHSSCWKHVMHVMEMEPTPIII